MPYISHVNAKNSLFLKINSWLRKLVMIITFKKGITVI